MALTSLVRVPLPLLVLTVGQQYTDVENVESKVTCISAINVDLRGRNMGKVAARMKVMPESPEVDLDDLEDSLTEALPDGAEISRIDREDVAFGLVAVFPTVLVPDEAGGTDAIETAFADVTGVESVSVDEVGRI